MRDHSVRCKTAPNLQHIEQKWRTSAVPSPGANILLLGRLLLVERRVQNIDGRAELAALPWSVLAPLAFQVL